jgi:hypothetical protein
MRLLDKYNNLIYLLEKHKYLTSDDFASPDITYIYLDYKFLKPIRFMDIGDISMEFNLNIFKEYCFCKIQNSFLGLVLPFSFSFLLL